MTLSLGADDSRTRHGDTTGLSMFVLPRSDVLTGLGETFMFYQFVLTGFVRRI